LEENEQLVIAGTGLD